MIKWKVENGKQNRIQQLYICIEMKRCNYNKENILQIIGVHSCMILTGEAMHPYTLKGKGKVNETEMVVP